MGEDQNLVRLPPIPESLRDEFRRDVKERFGGVKGHYRSEVENALREYLNAGEGGDTHDRLSRLEEAVDRIDERTKDMVDGEGAKKTKGSDVSPTTKNRLEEIRDVIERESGPGPVHEAVVRQAIEDVAGHSDPTIRRYKQMLTDRNILHPHPRNDSKFVFGDDHFVPMVQDLATQGVVSNELYWELVDHFGGEDVWSETLDRIGYDEEGDSRGGVGFQ